MFEIDAVLPLIGVVVGAMLAGGACYVLDRRADQSHYRAAVWMLLDDLERMRMIIGTETGTVGPMGTPRTQLDADPELVGWLTSDAWATERRQLARGLADYPEIWNQLRWVMLQADVLSRLVRLNGRDVDAITRRIATQDQLRTRIELLTGELASLPSV